jgi:hypothetical protein
MEIKTTNAIFKEYIDVMDLGIDKISKALKNIDKKWIAVDDILNEMKAVIDKSEDDNDIFFTEMYYLYIRISQL